MEDEIEEGLESVWKTLDEAIAIFEKEDTELRMMLTGVIAALLRRDEIWKY